MAGHGVGIDTQCGRKLMESFLYRPDQSPDSSCLVSDQPQFSDIYLNRGPRTMDTRGWGSGSSLRSTLFPVYAVAMASWMIQVAATTSWLIQPVATASWLIQGVAGVPVLIVWPLTVLTVWPLTVLTVWPIIFAVSPPASGAKLDQPVGGARSGDCRGSVADNRWFHLMGILWCRHGRRRQELRVPPVDTPVVHHPVSDRAHSRTRPGSGASSVA